MREVYPVASPRYLERRGRPGSVEELRAHDLLRGHDANGRAQTWWPTQAGDRITVDGGFASNDQRVLLEAALAGSGIALLSDVTAGRYVAEGTLERVLPETLGTMLVLARRVSRVARFNPRPCASAWMRWSSGPSRAAPVGSKVASRLVHAMLEPLVLARYRIVRGRRPENDPLPDGRRIDIRKHTRHVLRADPERVENLLRDPNDPERVEAFRKAYLQLLQRRFEDDPSEFEEIAEQARDGDVYLGCSCPTKRQPDVRKCHTVLALQFFRERFGDLEVIDP